MSQTRKVKRNQLREARKNKIVKFSDMWAELQNKKHGFEKAEAMRKVGKGRRSDLLGQVIFKTLKEKDWI